MGYALIGFGTGVILGALAGAFFAREMMKNKGW